MNAAYDLTLDGYNIPRLARYMLTQRGFGSDGLPWLFGCAM